MSSDRNAWTAYGSTSLFVLLWSGGAIFAKWGLFHASAFGFLLLRFTLALAVLLLVCAWRRRWLPEPGTRLTVAATGLLLIGGYSICYLLALDHGITPGVLATLLGAQPILTLAVMERRYSPPRLAGLLLALCGLVMVVSQSIGMARFSVTGMVSALAALLCMTVGAILQQRVRQAPMDVMPLQYAVSLALCLLFVPFQPIQVEWVAGFVIPLIWMGLVISVGATLLFYRMIQAGNLVNVTSLFYLVPAGTAVLDYLILGNRLSVLSLGGLGAILLGLMLVLRSPAPERA
ncbi:multidrug DMT transporter permease [Achromobacter insolitus]|uniref:DMT family transporter n=1 Tax=Achromobacter insolitus TaxID=217204 RepID=UPI0007C788D3|nr:DMT family transporter [Achromobacter insolitus]OAE60743.1 multidrug DMT transporter permease [Achromobacter insolitus]OCZ51611.1 multidrug DMT transporter permease [Achromobacter insolitus]